MAALSATLQPVVTALRPETILVPFTDYSQWERKQTKSHAATARAHTRTLSPLSTTRIRKACKSTAPEAKKHSTGSTSVGAKVRLQPMAVCNHGQGVRRKLPTVSISESSTGHKGQGKILKSPEKQLKSSRLGRSHEPTNIRLLRLQVAARRSSISEYYDYRDQLLADNISIIASIQHIEDQTNLKMHRLIEKYQKFKGAITTLKEKSAEQIKAAKADLEDTKKRFEKEISELRDRVDRTNSSIQNKSRELHILLHYKDKEYPIRMVRMEQLREQGDVQEERNSTEVADLEEQVEEEWNKCREQLDAVRMRLETRAAEASLSKMKRSVHQKAIQNRIMEKELLIHQQKKEELADAIGALKEDIRQLKILLKEHSSATHPHLGRDKCLPDTEFQLNIPLQQDLPV